MSNIDVACEILKLVRSEPLTQTQIASALDLAPMTVQRYVKGFCEHGFLDRTTGPEPLSRNNLKPVLYALSPNWGGKR